MKIGILTFHWGTNYGAVLQAYALQQYLIKIGHDVQIINYRPERFSIEFSSIFKTVNLNQLKNNIKTYRKEKKIKKFRAKYLNETKKYKSEKELQQNPPDLDVYIAGSDQIWNSYFTLKGENKPTFAYYLNFGKKDVIRVGYAVSFGSNEYPQETIDLVKNYIAKFNAIGVRERSGIEILKRIGYQGVNTIVLDPTLLLNANEYQFDINNENTSSKCNKAFFYILRDEKKNVDRLINYMKSHDYKISYCNSNNDLYVEEWINNFKNSDFIVTNSFHGVAFSLIYHKPFISIESEGKGAGMNDRFYTLLSLLNLDYRIIKLKSSSVEIDNIRDKVIDWREIDRKLKLLRAHSLDYINSILNKQ